MHISTFNIYADIKKPIRIFHITDLHLTLSDDREDAYCREHAAHRSGMYAVEGRNPAVESFSELLKYAQDSDLILFTGDMADFPSKANIDHLKEALKDKSFIFCHGNHDWNYPREYPFGTSNWDFDQSSLYDDALSKTAHLFYPFTSGSIDVCMVGEIRVITVNNSNYRFTQRQYERLKRELSSQIPTIIAFHVPLYAPTLMPDTLSYWHLPIICGGGDDVHSPYWSYRTDEPTAKACKLIGEHPSIIAVITGHLHFDHTDVLPGGNTQYVTALANRGNAAIFNILPSKKST